MIGYGSLRPLERSRFGIVRIRTDEGLEGIGEISVNAGRDGAYQCQEVNHLLRPALVGENALAIRKHVQTMDLVLPGSEPAKAGVEMALFDLAGKAFGAPVYQLLGGKVRERARVAWPLGFGEPDAGGEEAAAWAARGFTTIKVKIGRPGTGADAEMVAAVRAAVGDAARIRVDANGAYASPLTAIREIQALEQYDLQLVEQPLGSADLEGSALVRSRITTPLLLDESVRHWRDAYAVACAGAADAVCVYVSQAGGLLAAANAFAIAHAAGLSGVVGSQCELGIGTAAMAHLAVTTPNLAYDSDISGHLRYDHDVIEEQLDYEDGAIAPPDRPGLGVTLDEDRLEQFRVEC
jgi:muconate cycloisomerase